MAVNASVSNAVCNWKPSTSTVVPEAVPTPTASMCTPEFWAIVAA